MAGTTVCVSCAQLPMKDRSVAVKTSRCPECKAEHGVTSYGAAFRIQPSTRRLFLSPAFLTGATIGAGLFTFAVVLIALGILSREQMVPVAKAPDLTAAEQLARVQEVAVDKPFPANIDKANGKAKIQQLIAQIRDANQRDKSKPDAFLIARMQERSELRGMPFVMGDACRLNLARAQSFQNSVQAVREGQERDLRSSETHDEQHTPFWNTYFAGAGHKGSIDTDHGVAALTQILGPESKSMRFSLVERLKMSNRPEATRAIARAAVFDASGDVRLAAIKALKDRNNNEDVAITNEILMQGIRYPLPVVAGRARDVMLALERKELLPQLVAFLGEPAPGDPEERDQPQQECVVREVVKINHHRNCLLCHPPSQTGQTHEVPGVIPIPGTPFPSSPREAYGAAQSSGEPMIRADTTYLRQDFSVLMPVANAAPWPEMQRFDFLVRTRVVEGDELAALRERVQARGEGWMSANHKAAIDVLQELTGQREVAPNRAAWQRALNVAKVNE